MKSYACIVLILMVFNTEIIARPEEKDLDELNNLLRSFVDRRNNDKQAEFEERFVGKDVAVAALKRAQSSNTTQAPKTTTEAESESEEVRDPIRITVFNAADYRVHVKVNYVLNGKQQEQELASDIEEGEHRSLFMPVPAIYIRVRIQKTTGDQVYIADQQIRDLDNHPIFCYLVAHTRSNPVYGLCPLGYEDMLVAWGLF